MHRLYVFTVLLGLTGCVDTYQQPYAVQPPTMTQTQGQCFSKFESFIAQTQCINNAVIASGLTPNSYVQEYLAYMQSLREKVKRKTLSENEARIQLASKLNEVKVQQQNEDAIQEQLTNQRTMQTLEILKQNQPKPLELYVPPQPTITDCNRTGDNVRCTTR